MIKAIIFDFNGVIADDEPLHVLCFQRALEEGGLSLTAKEYYGTYLGMDERTCTSLLLTARDGRSDEDQLRRIMSRKHALFREETARQRPALFKGVTEFVKAAKPYFRLAVASGGRKEQIDRALIGSTIEHDFELIVSADDCAIGKPDPSIYLMTLHRLNAQQDRRVSAGDCLVIEDSQAGIQAARAAGMKVLALATTYPAAKLTEAALVLPSLDGVAPWQLAESLDS